MVKIDNKIYITLKRSCFLQKNFSLFFLTKLGVLIKQLDQQKRLIKSVVTGLSFINEIFFIKIFYYEVMTDVKQCRLMHFIKTKKKKRKRELD